MTDLAHLEPAAVFRYFRRLCAVPHGSGNTQRISDLCVSIAGELGLDCRQEPCGNVIIRKNGSPGCENADPIILQGHMDMVCVKTADCPKDMTREGLDLRTDGEWLWADKTSLGGDDGVAIAIILAILADDTLRHPPLEAVFTVDEEVGMDGARLLDASDLRGRKLLNLDSEQEGVFTVSCAGGLRCDCLLPAAAQPAAGLSGLSVVVSGLRGGHSGTDIHRGRANANRLMARTLRAAQERFPDLRLSALSGGRFDNVICPRCDAAVALPAAAAAPFAAFLAEYGAALQSEYAVTDPDVTLTCAPASVSAALSAADTARVLRAFDALPQGVETMDTDFPGLVQTSLNMGMAHLTADGLCLTYSVRSSVASAKRMLAQRLRSVTELAGGTVTERGDYPGWQYKRDSRFRDTLLAAYKDLTGKDGVIEGTHGGLECGLLMEKLPGLDAVSLGPDIPDIHSVRERLSVPGTARTYALVCELLRRSC